MDLQLEGGRLGGLSAGLGTTGQCVTFSSEKG